MNKMIYIYSLLLVCVAIGCNEEKALTPSEAPELIYGKYTLPQGDHDYDKDILSFYKECSSLLLYKFTSKDFGWNVSGNVNWDPVRDTIGGGFEAMPADEQYVGQQIDLLNKKLFAYFPKSFLAGYLPQRILLCSKLNQVQYGLDHYPTDEDRIFLDVYNGFHHIAVNWGNKSILTMTATEKNTFKNAVCQAFFLTIFPLTGSGLIEIPQSFVRVSNYTLSFPEGDKKAMYGNGILDYGHRSAPLYDWFDYIKLIVSTPYDELTSEGGVLSPEVDVNGKVREKYDLMINFFKTGYGFDLQAIGDDVEK